jgi:hypothetical protein
VSRRPTSLLERLSPKNPTMSVSILILNNHNEGISGCLHSVKWSDDIHVLDSTDSAHIRSLAERHGARVTHCADQNARMAHDAAIAGIPFQYPWLLVLNAHERASAAIKAELELMLFHSDPEMPYRIQRHQSAEKKPTPRTCATANHLRKFSSKLARSLSHDRETTASGQPHARKRVPWRALGNFAHTLILKRALLAGRRGIALACLGMIHECSLRTLSKDKMPRSLKSKAIRTTYPPQESAGSKLFSLK